MQRKELSHVAIRPARQTHRRPRIEQRRRHHAGQRVEIGIGMRDDEVHRISLADFAESGFRFPASREHVPNASCVLHCERVPANMMRCQVRFSR